LLHLGTNRDLRFSIPMNAYMNGKLSSNKLEQKDAMSKRPGLAVVRQCRRSSKEMQKTKFSVKELYYTYRGSRENNVDSLRNINLDVSEHEFLSVVGPSGCGKSTLLNVMSGLIRPEYGEVTLDGFPISGISPKIGYISQTDSLFPWRTVRENVEFGLELKKVSKRARRDVARELISRAGLAGFENSYPHELSGGMKKRVDIIRVLAVDPEVILMDEPFGALDVFTKEKLQEYILEIWRRTRKTIVFVTHDLTEAVTMADRVVLMTAQPSTIKGEYPIPLKRPRHPMEVRFLPEFIELNKTIWEDLREEVGKAEVVEIG
jgi:NitT/TauT family transport system ATP-binding protein